MQIRDEHNPRCHHKQRILSCGTREDVAIRHAAPPEYPSGSNQPSSSRGQDFSPGPLITRAIVICEIKLVRDAMVRNIINSKLSVLTEGYQAAEDWRPDNSDDSPIVIIYWKKDTSFYRNLRYAIASIVSKSPRSRIIVVSELLDVDVMKQAYIAGAKAFIGVQASFDMLRSIIQLVIIGQLYFPFELLSEGRNILRNSSIEADGSVLTARQIKIVEYVTKGMSNKEIAAELGLKERTVKASLLRIMRKIGARNRSEIAYKLRKP